MPIKALHTVHTATTQHPEAALPMRMVAQFPDMVQRMEDV